MDKKKLSTVFNKIKKGDKVNISYQSVMENNGKKIFLVKSKNVVLKGKITKITLVNTKNTTGLKFYLYKRNESGYISFATGDMGASIKDVKIL